MNLVIFNGSPRGRNSNSNLIIESFCKGYASRYASGFTTHYLMETDKFDEYAALCRDADAILIVFPLYVDSMPGIVKLFLEKLSSAEKMHRDKQVSYMIHSGFPEAVHCSYVARYLEKYTHRLGIRYMGTIHRGGSEGLRITPEKNRQRYLSSFYQLGKYYADHHCHDKNLIKKLKTPYQFKAPARFFIRVLQKTGMMNMYWNKQLKQNRAYKNRFDTPYETQ